MHSESTCLETEAPSASFIGGLGVQKGELHWLIPGSPAPAGELSLGSQEEQRGSCFCSHGFLHCPRGVKCCLHGFPSRAQLKYGYDLGIEPPSLYPPHSLTLRVLSTLRDCAPAARPMWKMQECCQQLHLLVLRGESVLFSDAQYTAHLFLVLFLIRCFLELEVHVGSHTQMASTGPMGSSVRLVWELIYGHHQHCLSSCSFS